VTVASTSTPTGASRPITRTDCRRQTRIRDPLKRRQHRGNIHRRRARSYPDGAVRRGMTALQLFLAGTCGPTLGIAYSIAHPKTEAAQEVGSRQLRVSEGQTYEALRLGPAPKFTPLAPPPPRAVTVPTGVERAKPVRSMAARRPRRGAQTAAPPTSVNTPAPVKTPALPPSAASDLATPRPRRAPTGPASNVVTFDDSG
jgi:hypothetical protein